MGAVVPLFNTLGWSLESVVDGGANTPETPPTPQTVPALTVLAESFETYRVLSTVAVSETR
jgi:hypothetical protein